MKYGYDVAPAKTREAVIKNIDFVSAHSMYCFVKISEIFIWIFIYLIVMPYYGTCDMPGDVWQPIVNDINAYRAMIPGKQFMITQNPWGANRNGRNRGSVCGNDVWKDVSVDGANTYWKLWTRNCAYFKQQKIGWFTHVFSVCLRMFFFRRNNVTLF